MLSCVIRQAYVVLFTRDTLGITLLHNSTPSETSFKGKKNTTGLCHHPCCWNMPAQRMRMPRARFVETTTTSHYSCKREYTRRARSGCVHGAGRRTVSTRGGLRGNLVMNNIPLHKKLKVLANLARPTLRYARAP